MKEQTVNSILVVIIIVIFCSYFSIRHVVWNHLNFNQEINRIEADAKAKNWVQATHLAKDVQKKWERYKLLTTINYGEAEFTLFDEALTHIVAGSEAKDLPTVLEDTQFSKHLWTNFNRLVPEP